MKKFGDTVFYTATDLCNFSDCQYLVLRDKRALSEKLDKTTEDDQAILITRKGQEHEQRYLATLTTQGTPPFEPRYSIPHDPLNELSVTLNALQEGHSYVYQAMLAKDTLWGLSDFLKRVEKPSKLGAFSYEVVDTKLGKSHKATYALQLCFYSELLESLQGTLPEYAYIVDGTGNPRPYRVADYYSYYQNLKNEFLTTLTTSNPATISPEPCSHCSICHWRTHCKDHWEETDHLSRVARITGPQRKRFMNIGVTTMSQLAAHQGDAPAKIAPRVFTRLKEQARLQIVGKEKPSLSFVHPDDGGVGFKSLPPRSEGDLFYDIEADPLIKAEALENEDFNLRDGLEYLHGFSYRNSDKSFGFTHFLAFTKAQERVAYENLMDFMIERVTKYPDAHIYHYSPYEVAALKRMSAQYPSRTDELDRLLKEKRFVDLYEVVRNAIRVSEPKYSIKNLERFYSAKRDLDVKGGGDSIVVFERYLETKDPEVLQKIIDYNRKDCDSTIELLDWLHDLKAQAAQEFKIDWATINPPAPRKERKLKEDEVPKSELEAARLHRYRTAFDADALLETAQEQHSEGEKLREKLFYLSDFYRREMKPAWWKFFSLKDSPEKQDAHVETLTNLRVDPSRPEGVSGRSRLVHYIFPPRETKLETGDAVHDVRHDQDYGTIDAIDPYAGTISIKLRGDATTYDHIDITKKPEQLTDSLREGLDRFLDAMSELDLENLALLNRDYPHTALVDILQARDPVFRDDKPRPIIVPHSAQDPEFADALFDAAIHLDGSYLFIQGPPGTGKTYHGARLAVALMKAGKSVGVTSNSHKAVNNFLSEVDHVAQTLKRPFRGVKKSNKEGSSQCYHQTGDTSFIENCFKSESFDPQKYNLLAGTAWAFAYEHLYDSLDYLFVDEASQMSIAHLMAAGSSAKNLILIGDPCQLPQPIQGTHPADLHRSPLELLLGNDKTVPPHRGVFLDNCRRMHGEICSLLSKHVYENRLAAHDDNDRQTITNPVPTRVTQGSGILFVPSDHKEDSTTSSEDEAQLVEELVQELLNCSFTDKQGATRKLTLDDIMIIAPFNLQVKEISRRIPNGRVGTIDLFQGQEAPVAIVSMTSSNINETPRGLDFLFSTQRINVALSRAKALAIIVGSPLLLKTRCKTPEQMQLVNFFCALGR
jgi:uncharacterized protein